MSVWASLALGSGSGYSVVKPVFGSSLPMKPALLPVNQILPSLSSIRPCGPLCGVFRLYSMIAPVLGSIGPSLLDNCPPHQNAPSLAGAGSCGRDPSVGTSHILIVAGTGPAISTAGG